MGKMKEIFQQMQEEGYKGDAKEYLNNYVKNNPDKLIFERNPDSGAIRARKVGDYGNEKIINTKEVQSGPIDLRKEIADDLWAANKKLVDGKWYVPISDVLKIVNGEI